MEEWRKEHLEIAMPEEMIEVEARPIARTNSKGLPYIKVLNLIKEGEPVLSPRELSHLKQFLTASSRPYQKKSKYERWKAERWRDEHPPIGFPKNGAPYWSSQGMGYVCDLKGVFPDEFRGRFVVASIDKIDGGYNRVVPDFDDAIILKDSDLKWMNGWVYEWEARSKSGLAMPICAKNNQGLGHVNLEEVLREFGPIAVGCDSCANEISNYVSPNQLLGAWMKKQGEEKEVKQS